MSWRSKPEHGYASPLQRKEPIKLVRMQVLSLVDESLNHLLETVLQRFLPHVTVLEICPDEVNVHQCLNVSQQLLPMACVVVPIQSIEYLTDRPCRPGAYRRIFFDRNYDSWDRAREVESQDRFVRLASLRPYPESARSGDTEKEDSQPRTCRGDAIHRRT